jgi:hypothetical protein
VLMADWQMGWTGIILTSDTSSTESTRWVLFVISPRHQKVPSPCYQCPSFTRSAHRQLADGGFHKEGLSLPRFLREAAQLSQHLDMHHKIVSVFDPMSSFCCGVLSDSIHDTELISQEVSYSQYRAKTHALDTLSFPVLAPTYLRRTSNPKTILPSPCYEASHPITSIARLTSGNIYIPHSRS